MNNKMYCSKLLREYEYELLARDVRVANSSAAGLFTSVDCISIWIEPTVVKIGLDQTTGRAIPPVIDNKIVDSFANRDCVEGCTIFHAY